LLETRRSSNFHTTRDGTYSERVASTFEPFGGRFIVRGGRNASLEGEAVKGAIVVIAFESMEKAQAWYDSPAYRELRPIRERSAKSRTFIVEGSNRGRFPGEVVALRAVA